MGWHHRPPSEIQMGNGTVLVTLDSIGEIEQLFAPHLDALQSKLGSFQTTVLWGSSPVELIPVRGEFFQTRMQMMTGSQVLQVEYQHLHRPISLRRTLSVHPTEPLLLDHWQSEENAFGIMHQSVPWIGHSTSAQCSLFHPVFNGLVHHRGRRWIGIIGRTPTQWVRVGHLSEQDRYRMWSGERVIVGLNPDELRNFPAGPSEHRWDQVVQGCATHGAFAIGPGRELEFLIVCAESEKHLGQLIEKMEPVRHPRFLQMIEAAVQRRHEPALPVLTQIQSPRVRALCERSIDVLHALQDSRTGALMAAAEVDPHSSQSGGYGYSWPRDGAYLAAALGAFNYHDRVESYFRFLSETQDPSGAWWQRYLATGHAGPSWGRIQIDEPASVIVAAHLHFRRTQNHLWLDQIWPTLKKGLQFLEEFHSAHPPMGQPSHDLWEERMGYHAYSLGAVAAAFISGANLAGELLQKDLQAKYREMGTSLSQLIVENFLPLNGPIRRSLVGRDWDEAADVSLLGLIHPFRIIEKKDPIAEKILEQIRQKLWVQSVGGILRYERDSYRGGNPWILTTLWWAAGELMAERYTDAREGFQWVMSKATSLGMLPEQVHRETGKAFWVIPLAWSHAMFLLFVKEVLREKADTKIWDLL